MPHLGIFSGDYTQTTGQAIVTRRVVEHVLSDLGGGRKYIYPPAIGLRAIASGLGASMRLWRDVALGRVDTLYVVCSRSNAGFMRDVPALLTSGFGIRVIVHAHGSDIVELIGARPVSGLARMLYRRCELVVPSGHLETPLAGFKLRDLRVCENYTSGSKTDASIAAVGDGRLRVLWNSNIMAAKGAFDVLAACKQLAHEGLPVHLEMIGSAMGDEELDASAAEERIAGLVASNWLSYYGRVPSIRAAELVQGTDVVALPSRYSSECQPLAIIAAMCAGRGLVVSDIPPLRATVGEYPAEFVPVRNVSAVAEALRRLYDEKNADPAAFFACRSQPAERARERFSTARFDREMRGILSGSEPRITSASIINNVRSV
jgi:glycosyltransferase involved in cell wall biosynthesis